MRLADFLLFPVFVLSTLSTCWLPLHMLTTFLRVVSVFSDWRKQMSMFPLLLTFHLLLWLIQKGSYIRAEQNTVLRCLCWKSQWAFLDEWVHMLHPSHIRAAGRKQGRSCSQWSLRHAVSVSGAFGFACVRPNSYSIKILPLFHIKTPIYLSYFISL